MDWTEGLKQIGILVAAWVAVYGIDSWRREHAGKRRIELAEDSLSLFYEATDAIKHIRFAVSLSSETDSVQRGENENDKEFKARKNASIVFVRYNQYRELFSKLHAMRYRFMAQIGKSEAKPFDDLHVIVSEITGAAHVLARLWARDQFRTEQMWEQHQKEIEKYEAIFWEGLPNEDPINPRIAAVIAQIEATCRSVISGKGTIYSFLNWRIWSAR